MDNPRTLIRSAAKFFTGTMLSRFSGLFRDMAMAFAFGTHKSVAGFMVAFRFAHLLRRLFGEGAMQSAFIPQFEELRLQNPQNAGQFFRLLAAILSVGLTLIILAIMGGLWLLEHQLTLSPDAKEILFLTRLMMPSLLFICLYGLNAALMQCEKKFFLASVAPIAFNGIWILFALSLHHQESSIAMSWLSVGVIVACFAQWLFTIPSISTILNMLGKAKMPDKSQFWSPTMIQLCRALFLGILGVAASQINNALDALFARFAEGQGPAFLWFAIRIQQLPLALFGIAISSALLPPLSRAFKANNRQLYTELFDVSLQRNIFLTLPVTIALFVMGDSAINFLFGRGDFEDASIIGTTQCLWAYTLGLLPMTFVLIYAQAFYAQNDYRIPTIAALLSVGLNIFLNALFIFYFNWGATSVALATSVSAWLNFFFLSENLKRRGIAHFILILPNIKIFFCSLLAGISVVYLRYMLWNNSFLANTYSHLFFEQFMQLAIPSALFILIFGMASFLSFPNARKIFSPK